MQIVNKAIIEGRSNSGQYDISRRHQKLTTVSTLTKEEDKKIKQLIEYLTQVVSLNKDYIKKKNLPNMKQWTYVNSFGYKYTSDNPASQVVIEFLNQITKVSPSLHFCQLKTLKLPQIRDFKYKIYDNTDKIKPGTGKLLKKVQNLRNNNAAY